MKRTISNLKRIIKESRFGKPLLKFYWYLVGRHRKPLRSNHFWEKRYLEGGNSGPGSYGRLAEFKAETINSFVCKYRVESVMEFGCGDGNQLRLAKYPQYLGFDVSESAVKICRNIFADDSAKQFFLMKEYNGETADLVLSLDVIYHLVEDTVFINYLKALFSEANRYVIIYSSDYNHGVEEKVTYIRHRKFTGWINENVSGWQLMEHIPNPYPLHNDFNSESFADFYIYSKV